MIFSLVRGWYNIASWSLVCGFPWLWVLGLLRICGCLAVDVRLRAGLGFRVWVGGFGLLVLCVTFYAGSFAGLVSLGFLWVLGVLRGLVCLPSSGVWVCWFGVFVDFDLGLLVWGFRGCLG